MAYEFDYRESVEFRKEMITLGMVGLSLKECGDYFAVNALDWIEWCDEHCLTAAWHETGRVRGIAQAGQALMNQIRSGKIQAISFYLKTVGNFTEKSVMELQETLKAANIPVPIMPCDPVEASKKYQEWIKRP